MDFLGPSTLFVDDEDSEILTEEELISLPLEHQPAVTEHFHGAIDHHKHLFGKFFSLMGLEDITYVKPVTMCLVPLALL